MGYHRARGAVGEFLYFHRKARLQKVSMKIHKNPLQLNSTHKLKKPDDGYWEGAKKQGSKQKGQKLTFPHSHSTKKATLKIHFANCY